MKTNSLIYKTSKHIAYYGKPSTIYVKISLDDNCKNGHQDFAITGDIYTSDRYFACGGCIHEEIEKYFPKFKMFIDLHLCDYDGAPMYAVENGFYHLTNGFNDCKPTSSDFKAKYCEYYRIGSMQFDALFEAENETEYAILLMELGIVEQWKEQAQTAIKELELMTGDEFLNDSVKSQFNRPTGEQIAEFKAKKAAGYFSDEQKAIRAKQLAKETLIKQLTKLSNEYSAKQKALSLEYNLKRIFFKCGIPEHNWIHYTSDNRLVFNCNKSPYNKEIDKETALKAIKKADKLLKSENIKVFFENLQTNNI